MNTYQLGDQEQGDGLRDYIYLKEYMEWVNIIAGQACTGW